MRKSLDTIAATLQDATEPSETEQPCKAGEDNSRSDLCAQWTAAKAAESSAIAAWVFGVIGSIVGSLTLAAAVLAALYARRAAVATEDAAQIAHLAATAASDEARASRQAIILTERAIVVVDDVIATLPPLETPEGLMLHMSLLNEGKSNAHAFKIFYNVTKEPLFSANLRYSHNFDRICRTSGRLEVSPFKIRKPKTYPAYFNGYVSYRTLHESDFKTFFCFRLDGDIYRDELGSWANSRMQVCQCQNLPSST